MQDTETIIAEGVARVTGKVSNRSLDLIRHVRVTALILNSRNEILSASAVDINNVGVGTRVLFAGRPVGEVVSIEEIPQGRKQPVDELGRVYTYQLKIKIDSGIKVYDTDEVTSVIEHVVVKKLLTQNPRYMIQGANNLIFERIREEKETGKTPRSAISAGYHKAFSAILDANVTTLLTTLILFIFGTGPIKGFAVTLSLGILINLFTALVGTKVVYDSISSKRKMESLSI